jgi:apolipoprotein N-acyltransferase
MGKKQITTLFLLLTPLLFWLAWPPRIFAPAIFIVWVPLLLFTKVNKELKPWKYFLQIWASFILLNAATTWWVWHASPMAIAMILANALLMSIPWLLYQRMLHHFTPARSRLMLAIIWLSFEYIHTVWDIAWPWLTVGNALARYPFTFQWYEFTGVAGGSAWIWAINLVLYEWLLVRTKGKAVLASLTVGIPLIISGILYVNDSAHIEPDSENVVIVQPNVDPYVKFEPRMEVKSAVDMIQQAEEAVDSKTRWVILPETALVEYADEEYFSQFKTYNMWVSFCKRHPQIAVVAGANTYRFYNDGDELSSTVRYTRDGRAYDSYNTAILFNKDGVDTVYHKSKLVPGPEKMPWPEALGFLGDLVSFDLGGVTGSLGVSKEAVNFQHDSTSVAPLICYETVFPDYVRTFTRKGADALLIITNDGWWQNTAGHKQHLYYASLRAVENRRAIYRSANTGISAVVLPNGEIRQPTEYWTRDVIQYPLIRNEEQTVFVRLGDYLGRTSVFISGFFLLSFFVKVWSSRKMIE